MALFNIDSPNERSLDNQVSNLSFIAISTSLVLDKFTSFSFVCPWNWGFFIKMDNIEPVEFLHLNKNKRKKDKHYSHYYDDELYNLVTELYDIDLTTFDYKFEDKR